MIGILLVLILGGGGAAAYYVLKQAPEPTAEERFNQAITAHLQTPYIDQAYDMHMEFGGATADIKVTSSMDVSQPASPKISGKYTLTSNKALARTVDFVTTSRTKAYVSFADSETLSSSGLKPSTWYSYDPSDNLVNLAVDPFGIIKAIGTARGEFPIGRFTEEQQATILSQIASANPYTISSVVDEGQFLRYDLTITKDNFNKLDTVVAKLVGDDTESTNDAKDNDTTGQVWIDKQTNRFVKFTANKNKDTVKVAITYPSQYGGGAPKDSLDLMKTLEARTPTDAQAPVPAAPQTQTQTQTQTPSTAQ